MEKRDKLSKKIIGVVFSIFVLGVLIGLSFSTNKEHSMTNMKEMRSSFISLKDDIQHKLMPEGKYRCCLEKPCAYCIEKSPGHGEGATCNCLEDVVNGVHPCGECIGEILEGHGNPLLTEYFAKAISEEVGEEHIDTLKQIISEKYGISIREQV